MLTDGMMKALSLCLLVLAAACTPAPQRTDTYTSGSGDVVFIENDREACVRSCNADYDRCGDTRAAGEQVGRGQMTGVFGGAADCKADLKSCLSSCKAR